MTTRRTPEVVACCPCLLLCCLFRPLFHRLGVREGASLLSTLWALCEWGGSMATDSAVLLSWRCVEQPGTGTELEDQPTRVEAPDVARVCDYELSRTKCASRVSRLSPGPCAGTRAGTPAAGRGGAGGHAQRATHVTTAHSGCGFKCGSSQCSAFFLDCSLTIHKRLDRNANDFHVSFQIIFCVRILSESS